MRFFSSLLIVQVLVGATMLPCVAEAESGPAPVPIRPAVFRVIAAPDSDGATLVWGIVPGDPKTSPTSAASLAKYAFTMMRAINKKPVHIFVFADKATGQAFNRYQHRRRAASLAQRDYVALKKLWPRTLAFYEFSGGRERVVYPSRAPQSWWKR